VRAVRDAATRARADTGAAPASPGPQAPGPQDPGPQDQARKTRAATTQARTTPPGLHRRCAHALRPEGLAGPRPGTPTLRIETETDAVIMLADGNPADPGGLLGRADPAR